jgi:hypothetical protein
VEQVVCIDVSIYMGALTRGKTYDVLERDTEKRQVRLQADNGRVRWFPFYCFAIAGQEYLKVESIVVENPISNPYCDAVEITLHVVAGDKESKRWCYFLTPAYVYQMFENPAAAPLTLGRHGIFVPVLTEEQIQSAVKYLETHNLLEECTLALEG